MEQKLVLCDNGFEFMESYFKELYGDLGCYEQILNRYLDGIDFDVPGRVIDMLEDIPLISRSDIDKIIEYEESKKNAISDFISKYEMARDKDKLNDGNYLYLASLLGVVPFICPDSNPLYMNLLNFDSLSPDALREIQERVMKKMNIVRVMVDRLYDGFKDGMAIRIPDNGRQVWHQGNSINYYRGEHAYFGRSKASLYRTSDGHHITQEETEIGIIKIIDFSFLLKKIPFVKGWPYGDVFYPGIAQHYGLKTYYIDVTKDFKVALFFACTKWDGENKKWIPLDSSDSALDGRKKNLTANGGDPRYGVLFRAPSDINNFCAAHLRKRDLTPVYPIGYQPFIRCEKQSAYYIPASIKYDLYQDPTFQKIRFKLNEDLCQWIYNEMDQGQAIYPKDVSGDCSSIAEEIKRSNEYSEAALDYLLNKWERASEKEDYMRRFEKMGYKMKERPEFDTDEIIERFECEFINSGGYEFFKKRKCPFRFQFSI